MMKLQLLICRLPFYKFLISINSFLESPRLYCTNSVDSYCSSSSSSSSDVLDSGGRNKKKKETLYSRISPLGNPRINVTPVLDKWTEEGRKVRFAELIRIVLDLRKRSRFSQALQVSSRSFFQSFLKHFTSMYIMCAICCVFDWIRSNYGT